MTTWLIRLGALALAGALMLPGATRAAETVGVRVGLHGGYVRVVFDWTAAVGHRLERSGDTVALVFDRPLEADLDRARAALEGIATGVTLGADGARVVFTLLPGVAASAFETGGKVAIDLKPGQAVVVDDAPRVGVRANEENGRLRLVFDWPAPVAYTVAHDGATLRVRFDRPARLDIGGIAARASRARDFALDQDRMGLAMTIAPDAAVVDSIVDSRVVLDIAGPAADAASAPDRIAQAADAAPLPRAKPSREPAAADEPEPEPEPEPDTGDAAPAVSQTAAIRVPMAPTWARLREAPVDLDGALWPLLARIIPESDGAARLRLVTNRAAALAAFVRDGRLWLAFDQPFDVAVVAPAGTAPCADLAPVAVSNGSVLSCAVPEGFDAEVVRDGVVWEVTIGDGARPPARPLEPTTGDALAVAIPVEHGGIAIEVPRADGSAMIVVPVATPGAGVTEERATFGYRIVPTSQGVVVADLAPGVALGVEPGAVTIALHDAAGSLAAGGLLDVRGADAHEAERAATAAHAPAEERTAARLAYAQSLFAADMAPEAWGQVKLAASDDPGAGASPEVRALAGALLTRQGRAAEAGSFLDDPLLGGEWVELWRCVLDVRRGAYDRVPGRYREVTAPWIELPYGLRAWIGLELARGLALAGDPSMGQAVLVMGVGEKPTGPWRDRAALAAGHIRAALGDVDGAAKLWAAVATSKDREVSADARLALALAGLDAGVLDTAGAIEALEQLAFAWRGGDSEHRRLHKLVDLYLVDHRYRDALAAMRTILTHIPDAPDNPTVARRLADVFKDVMIGGASEFVSPLGTLAIFNEFQELTPVGADGDKLIETLAERLADVDLVAQAADLLELQLANRLTGAARVRVAVRVAELRLAAGDAAAALDALAIVGAEDVPDDLRHRRVMAQAGALAAEGRDDEALAALAGDTASDAVWLLAEMRWRQGDWRAATAALETLIARTNTGAEPWGTRTDLAFRLALGYASAGDTDAARAVGRRYGTLFADDPRRDMFTLITEPETARPADWKTLPGAIAEVPELEAFLAAYRADEAPAAPAPAEEITTDTDSGG